MVNTEALDGFGLKYLPGSNNNNNNNNVVCLCICALPVLVTLVRADPAAERREDCRITGRETPTVQIFKFLIEMKLKPRKIAEILMPS